MCHSLFSRLISMFLFKAVVNLFVYATDNLHARGLGYHIQSPKIIYPDLEKKIQKQLLGHFYQTMHCIRGKWLKMRSDDFGSQRILMSRNIRYELC